MINMDTLYQIGYGLFVVSTRDGKKDNGCIVNAFMQVALTPPWLCLSISKLDYTCEIIQKTGEFCASILTESAPFDLFRRFGFQSGRTLNKFTNFPDKKRAENGLLYLTKDCNGYICGKVREEIDCGSHIVFLADTTQAQTLSKDPSLTYAYYFKHTKPAPPKTKTKGYRCKICGFVYEGEPLPDDYICPICKHPASDFEKIE